MDLSRTRSLCQSIAIPKIKVKGKEALNVNEISIAKLNKAISTVKENNRNDDVPSKCSNPRKNEDVDTDNNKEDYDRESSVSK